MLIKELLALDEAAKKSILADIIDEMEYQSDNDDSVFSLDSSKVSGNKATFSLEDENGHRALSYDASVEIKGSKLVATCGDSTQTFDLKAKMSEDEISELASEIRDVFSDGVRAASAADNQDEDGDGDEDNNDD